MSVAAHARSVRGSVALAALAVPTVLASGAFGHPMGNASINHYAGIEVHPSTVVVKYLLDYAEIPSVRELERVDGDLDDRVTPDERDAYLDAKTAEVLANLRLQVNGRIVPLVREWSHVTFPPGEGGLSTVRVAWELRGNLEAIELEASNFLVWADENHAANAGWKEMRFRGLEGVGIGRTSIRELPSSGELSRYPEEILFDPPHDTKGWCLFGPGLGPTELATGSPSGAETGKSVPEPPASSDHGGRRWLRLLAALGALGALALATRAATARLRPARRAPDRGQTPPPHQDRS